MASTVPDEILSAILHPVFDVPDSEFSAHFAPVLQPRWRYLLVCCAWRRVGTPLLYRVVILKSKAQAKTLSTTLSASPELGRYIKKLRVEGGYGALMLPILRHAPRITDLFLVVDIVTPEKTEGLCAGLSLVSPRRLILRSGEYHRKPCKALTELLDALVEAIVNWDLLTVFESAFVFLSPKTKRILQALAAADRLRVLRVANLYHANWVYKELAGCSLEAVELTLPYSENSLVAAPGPELQSLLRFSDQ
ncbi:F-box domain-containing protein [Mycena indigotica]|uniref:F-box domain-containing protein n=1 Tax=Mycena indigotica TaxID=2126181 RepID=A0A8H6S0D4_9AGAR|nr:F-box domain-containing protein [Mycena indigotica]KAF7288970.1 F-box domain-containing protein [Mycena indigotica]